MSDFEKTYNIDPQRERPIFFERTPAYEKWRAEQDLMEKQFKLQNEEEPLNEVEQPVKVKRKYEKNKSKIVKKKLNKNDS